MVRPVDFSQVKNAEAYMLIYALRNPNAAASSTLSHTTQPLETVPRSVSQQPQNSSERSHDHKQVKPLEHNRPQSTPHEAHKLKPVSDNTGKLDRIEQPRPAVQQQQRPQVAPQFKPLINITAYPGGTHHPLFGSQAHSRPQPPPNTPSWSATQPSQLQKRAPEVRAQLVAKKIKRIRSSGLLRLQAMRKRLNMIFDRSVSINHSESTEVGSDNLGSSWHQR